MSVDVPQPFRAKLEGPVGPVTVDGIPNPFHVAVDSLPRIAIGIEPVAVAVSSLPKISIGLDPLTINPIRLEPLDIRIAIDRIPDVRAHLPVDVTLGMRVLGCELLALRLTGEAQVITEPFVPTPCEVAGPPPMRPQLPMLPEDDRD